jgi:hypothetical protein
MRGLGRFMPALLTRMSKGARDETNYFWFEDPYRDAGLSAFPEVIVLNRYNRPGEFPSTPSSARHADFLFLERRRHPQSTRK